MPCWMPGEQDQHREREDEGVETQLHDHQAVEEPDRGADRRARRGSRPPGSTPCRARGRQARRSATRPPSARARRSTAATGRSCRSAGSASRRRRPCPSAAEPCAVLLKFEVVKNAGLDAIPTMNSTAIAGSERELAEPTGAATARRRATARRLRPPSSPPPPRSRRRLEALCRRDQLVPVPRRLVNSRTTAPRRTTSTRVQMRSSSRSSETSSTAVPSRRASSMTPSSASFDATSTPTVGRDDDEQRSGRTRARDRRRPSAGCRR